jgi:hypothetical protein
VSRSSQGAAGTILGSENDSPDKHKDSLAMYGVIQLEIRFRDAASPLSRQ